MKELLTISLLPAEARHRAHHPPPQQLSLPLSALCAPASHQGSAGL
eukprot:CAMPEP_0185622810 /NCGR_PEP_ID=MMETSP0436-20130131/59454_1 /TAXON_ID=626734 ORGANISM="Favella taraikaensis, Strain Fe Narragansett Bay" /NCGR_SAMPLE_ID=MMETSP0436 /ASSEMBLY_ACC=CAM_ASM_000390 /LENGTH=45 /DNA_ID= /DNA_START= /DNA_END= /DNA_ORIENTATION=